MATRVQKNPGDSFELFALIWGGGTLAVVAGSLYSTMTLLGESTEGGPVVLPLRLALGKQEWPGTAATVVFALHIAVVLGLVFAGWRWRRGRRKSHTAVPAEARYLARGKELALLAPPNAAAKARALLGDAATSDPDTHGPLLGIQVPDGVPLRSSWEDTSLVIAGPRTMKTTTQVIPVVAAAPGPAFVTSNKRDVVDALRGVREERGQVWIFDPQQMVNEPQTWWWNPLRHVESIPDAARLAAQFASAKRDGKTNRDAYFDPAGEQLLADMLLAAAAADMPITVLLNWLSNPQEREPAMILQRFGHTTAAATLTGVINLHSRQRDGIYGTAMQMASALKSPSVAQWVTPPTNRAMPEFRPDLFATSTDTMFAISREGADTAAPLVTALTAVTLEIAERTAARYPNGRLPLPLSVVLDEAANVCKIRDLPDLYSHYGSRGITLRTILQSYQQGEVVWGREGMAKLWSASNIRIYGGGVADTQFLKMLSDLVGERDDVQVSVSRSDAAMMTTRSSSSRSFRRLAVLDVSQLASLPSGYALLVASQVPAAMIQAKPWWETNWKSAVENSIARYEPGSAVPIDLRQGGYGPDAPDEFSAAAGPQTGPITHPPLS